MATLKTILRFARRQLPPLNFITVHYLYFIITCLLSSIIFWGASTPARSVRYIDSLFLTVSAMSLAGLNTINLSTLNTFQQVMLFILIIIGSAIFVSAFVVQVRRAAFERKFQDVLEGRRLRRIKTRASSRSSRRPSQLVPPSSNISVDPLPAQSQFPPSSAPYQSGKSNLSQEKNIAIDPQSAPEDLPPSPKPEQLGESSFGPERNIATPITFAPETNFSPHSASSAVHRRRESLFSMQGVGARPNMSLDSVPSIRQSETTVQHPTRNADQTAMSNIKQASSRRLDTIGGWISRNSQFHGLTEAQRVELGGYEYRAVTFLAWLVPIYFVLWQLLGSLGCAAWVAINQPDTAIENGLNPWWVGAFNAISAFNNSGMSLLDANMVAFQDSDYLLLTMGLLILAGNTAYPLFLRLIVWSMYKMVNALGRRSETWTGRARTLRFLLDHPRRCYTNLFPSQHTWWLLFAVVSLNGVDWAAFEILNIGNRKLYEGEPTGVRVIDGLFQALAVRSGGFYVVTITNLRISLQVLYVVMMYISVYPVVITMRNSNVYEERSLGIYSEDEFEQQKRRETSIRPGFVRTLTGHLSLHNQSNSQFVRQQLRAQLAHDAWVIVLALFLIMIIEGSQFSRDPVDFSVFNFLFEIVSAYGCVGISVGVPNNAYSFCGAWHSLSKLILCVVMIRGRHRGLPVAIDKAVLLPGDGGEQLEEQDGRIRLARSMSRDGAREANI